MKVRELLCERIINLYSYNEKQKYADEVWDLINKSYIKAGGFYSSNSKEDLINNSKLWKLVLRNGRISALKVYKDRFGLKSIALASDGTLQGKNDVKMLVKDDVKYERMWGEFSGAPEHILKKFNAIPIKSKFAEFLTGHKILSYDADGYHYTRLIKGNPKTKIIYGVAKVSQTEIETLKLYGIDLKEIPNNITII